VPSIAIDSANSNLVYAATNTPGSLKISQNGGGTWSDASLAVTFYSLATSPTNPGILYAGTSNGIYSYQAGTWENLGLAGTAVTALATDPVLPDKVYAGTTSGAYYTIDGGVTWKSVDQDLTGFTIQSINIDPIRNSWVYFSTKTHGIYLATIIQ
jgi:ligand-binding sensor domain-containing protein